MWCCDIMRAVKFLSDNYSTRLIYKIQGNEIWTTAGEVFKINTSSQGTPIELVKDVDWRNDFN